MVHGAGRVIVGVPCVDLHETTALMVNQLAATVRGPFRLVIVDNASERPYAGWFVGTPFPAEVIRYERNVGFYRPLLDLWRRWPGELVVLMHNDLLIYEAGWDMRLAEAFARDPKLGLVGFCGSWEVDENGGRGGGTMCHFRGEHGQSQDAGERITDLRPSAVLDSLFMAFRPEAVPVLEADQRAWDDLPLAHFYDKIWPMRLIEKGWRVATLGVEVDHWGGLTAVGMARIDADIRRWVEDRGVVTDNAGLRMYLEAERRWLGEYRDQKRLIPGRMHGWEYRPRG